MIQEPRNGHRLEEEKKIMKLKWVKLNALPLKSNEQTKISQTVNYLNLIIELFNNDKNNNIKMSRAVFFMTINENVSTVWAALYEKSLYIIFKAGVGDERLSVIRITIYFLALPYQILRNGDFLNSRRFHSWGLF